MRFKEKAKTLPVEGGWSAILPLPAGTDELGFVLQILERDDVQLQPGFFYDFQYEGCAMLSLLSREDEFAEGVERLLRTLKSCC